MKDIFTDVILRGGFNLSGLLKKIDVYHIEGKLTDEDREYLKTLAINHADVTAHPEYAAIVEHVKSLMGGEIDESAD